MDGAFLDRLFAELSKRFTVGPGLSDAEVDGIQARYGFRFPPDLLELLQHALPMDGAFTNWRSDSSDVNEVEHRLNDPMEGVLMQIGFGFWWQGWGERPAETIAAYEAAFGQIGKVPLLIPVYGKCYLPASPFAPGNPIFFAEGPEVTLFAANLEAYLAQEFLGAERGVIDSARHIEFWSDLAHK